MQMFNFDFMRNDRSEPIETFNNMLRTLNEAKNRCKNLYAGRGITIGAHSVRVRENGGTTIVYSWPEETLIPQGPKA